jgi:hypothetical protein
MALLKDRVGASSSTVGSGTVALGAGLPPGTRVNPGVWKTFAEAGVTEGQAVRYLILDSNGNWEYGLGTYSEVVASPMTLDPATAVAVTLSNGNLTATNTGTTATNQGALGLGASAVTSGKYYFEITTDVIPDGVANNRCVGIATVVATYPNLGTNGTGGNIYYYTRATNNIWSNGTNLGITVSPVPVAGSKVCVAADFDNKRIWFRVNNGLWNNNASANPATNVGGATIIPTTPMVPCVVFGGSLGVAGNALTANFGATAYAQAVPSGFSNWPLVVSAASPAFDPATATAVVLSGGNLIVTGAGTTSVDQGAKLVSASGKTSGKYYFEQTILALTLSPNRGTGIGTTASTYTNMGNSATSGVNMYPNTGGIFAGGVNTAISIGARAAGDVIGYAVDLDNRRIWIRPNPGAIWNNNAANDPVTNVGGITIPAGTMVPFCTFGGASGVAGSSFKANFGASAFAGTVPAGFTAGWPP